MSQTANQAGDDAGEVRQSARTLTRTVRHAFVSWEVVPTKPGEPFQQFRISRGETYDFPAEVVERYEPFGAFEPITGQQAPVFGEVNITPESSDADLSNFVATATAVELARFVQSNPDMADRISQALETAAGTVNPPQGPTTADGVATSDGSQDPTGKGAVAPVNNPDGSAASSYKDPGVIDPAEVAAYSKVSDITAYLADHPDQANDVLQAENARTNNSPRPGVVKAAEAAAAHSG